MTYGANSEPQRLRAKAKTLTVWIWIIGAVGVFFAASQLSRVGRGAENPASGGTAYLAGYLIAAALFVIAPWSQRPWCTDAARAFSLELASSTACRRSDVSRHCPESPQCSETQY